jgi:acyl-CoA dehydrogenase
VPLVLNDVQAMVRDGAMRFFAAHAPIAALRARRAAPDDPEPPRTLWRSMADMGYAGVLIPEEWGGTGLGWVAAGQIQEAIGTALAATPFVSTAGLAARALLDVGTAAQRARYLSAIAAGKIIVAFAGPEEPRHDPARIATRARAITGGYEISGLKAFVADGALADHFLVLARVAGDVADRQGLAFFMIDRDMPGVHVTRLDMIDIHDATRLRLENVRIAAEDRVGNGEGWPLADALMDAGSALLAAELLGLSEESFRMTLNYLKQREQFGVKIGSFQALQHRAADMFCELAFARSAVLRALQALDEREPAAPLMVSVAKAKAGAVAKLITNEAMQMHGGIAMTDAFDLGFFLKRGQAARELLGDEHFHRARVASLLGY